MSGVEEVGSAGVQGGEGLHMARDPGHRLQRYEESGRCGGSRQAHQGGNLSPVRSELCVRRRPCRGLHSTFWRRSSVGSPCHTEASQADVVVGGGVPASSASEAACIEPAPLAGLGSMQHSADVAATRSNALATSSSSRRMDWWMRMTSASFFASTVRCSDSLEYSNGFGFMACGVLRTQYYTSRDCLGK